LTIHQLSSQQIQPHIENAETIFNAAQPVSNLLSLQQRLASALARFCPQKRQHFDPRFILIKSSESHLLFSLYHQAVKRLLPSDNDLVGYTYHINNNKIILRKSQNRQENFGTNDNCLYAQWFDSEMLFGCVRHPEGEEIKLQTGLVHNANGGILILGLRTLLNKPELWFKLKSMVIKGEFNWLSGDDNTPLPYNVPSLPLDLRIMLIGDRLSLSDLQEFDPEFYQSSLYAEFENELLWKSDHELATWAGYLKFIQQSQQLPELTSSACFPILKAAVRHTEDQQYLPLSPDWIYGLLTDAAQLAVDKIDQHCIEQALQQKQWRESYLIDRFKHEIFSNMITIDTQGEIIGQINGLSVIEYPGYPRAIGQPARLSGLVHFGDGEFIDIERKSELAGNLHSKGMMIMQAFITAEFALYNQLPFSVSLVFEQSYNEIDGDSASLAGLCVLISALAMQPIDQQVAVTGSVDQFGHVQAIGGVNEKIESFFAVCQHRGLTGQQGVIIPSANQSHLCLNDDIVMAVTNKQFHIWTVEHVAEALYLLTGIPYKDNNHALNLYHMVQSRIQQALLQDKRPISNHWLTRLFKR
jgi:Lon-like ATP-dependent protease